MGMHLCDGRPVIIGQAADTMGDMKLMLAHDSSARVGQQLIVMQQRACDGILYRHHCYRGRIVLHRLKHLFEGSTANELYLFILEIQMGRYIVERPCQSLYRYSLHRWSYLILLKETPLSPVVVKRSCISILQFFNSSILTYGFPLHKCLQSKNNSRKSKRSTSSYLKLQFFNFSILLQK